MAAALTAKHYDVNYTWGLGMHSNKQGGAIMPDMLRWLWRDYPSPVTVHEPAAISQPGWDPRAKVYSTVWADKGWEQVGATYSGLSNAASDKEGNVYFAAGAGPIYKSDASGKVAVFKQGAGANALAAGPDGRLYASQRNRIVSYGPGGDEKVAAQNVEAGSLAITAGSAFYFIDRAHKSIGYAGPDGKVRTVYDGGGFAAPSGLALSHDQAMLIVTDSQARYSWSFQIAPDGSRFWLGTDLLGRDILSRMIFGARTVVIWAGLSTRCAYIVGVAAGLGREATAILSVAIALAILSSARLFKSREEEDK